MPEEGIAQELVGVVVGRFVVDDDSPFPVKLIEGAAAGAVVAADDDDIAVDDTVGGIPLLAANPNRVSALVQNVGTAAMRVTTDGSPPTSTHGKRVAAGESLSLSAPCSKAEIKAIREGATSTTANASEVSTT